MSDEGNNKRDEERRLMRVRVDATDLAELREEYPQDLRTVARRSDGTLLTERIELDDGEGVAEIVVSGEPDNMGVFIGPADATPEELVASQTITVNVPRDRWEDVRELELEPIRVPPYHWIWWHRWCRTFVIRGRLECPDGRPVPGAEVCAKDVDGWFIWSSTDQVGCDTTDEHGTFEIKFRWCCGFWPWWWWQNRTWRPDPVLLREVQDVSPTSSDLSLGRGSVQPSLDVFGELLSEGPVSVDRPLTELDPGELERLRSGLVERLPERPELRRLHVWPWYPWRPWWDCTPDIIFEATQDGTTVLEEDIGDTRWNISNPSDVVLTANDEAQCRGDCREPPCTGGECLVVTRICNATIDQVGGNLGAQASPEGYLRPDAVTPGTAAHNGDRPFAGTVTLWRNSGTLEDVDYLEVEYDDGTGWAPVPNDGVEDFVRRYFDPPTSFVNVPFKFDTIDGHYVVETREHYEAASGLTWDAPGSDRFWLSNRDLLVPLDSQAFPDGTYRFRFVGWEDGGGGTELTNRRTLPVCGDEEQRSAEAVLTFDNRLNPDPAHPTSSTHPCGSGTVHNCVTEPDTDIIDVRIGGTSLDPCAVEPGDEGPLEVDFMVHDPDGHLSHYSLIATYAENQKVNLLSNADSLEPTSGPSPGPPFPGPTYGEALGQGATQPSWHGGEFTLTIDDLSEAFPEPCCYQLELRGWKRTVVGCSSDYDHRNLSEYTFGVGL